QGERSEPDWAIPMIGLPACSSSRDSPKFMYRSRYSAVMSVLSAFANQRRDLSLLMSLAPDAFLAGFLVDFVAMVSLRTKLYVARMLGILAGTIVALSWRIGVSLPDWSGHMAKDLARP